MSRSTRRRYHFTRALAFFGAAAKPYWHFVNHGSVTTEGCSIWGVGKLSGAGDNVPLLSIKENTLELNQESG